MVSGLLAVGRALVQLVEIGRNVGSLPREVVVDGAVERGMREPMERAGRLGQEAARVLVLALRAALEQPDAALDAELERLVVARLEVQPRHPLRRAPVAAVERFVV